MAKVKHNNFIDTVDEVITNAANAGVIHLRATGEALNGRHITINGKPSYHFGTTGYLGLEQDRRLKNAAKTLLKSMVHNFPYQKHIFHIRSMHR
ncbi:hypothetical protein [Zunongwangia profunda]|uniref:hypothetical protein n=1 Tax=Zunongwangia profunda TaxID=398743 RepID=UPI0030D99237